MGRFNGKVSEKQHAKVEELRKEGYKFLRSGIVSINRRRYVVVEMENRKGEKICVNRNGGIGGFSAYGGLVGI